MGTICYLAVSLQPYPLIKPGVSLGVWRLIWLSFVMLTGLIVYFGMAILTKSEEMRFLIDAVKSKMRVKPS
jgi:hypothetical protein